MKRAFSFVVLGLVLLTQRLPAQTQPAPQSQSGSFSSTSHASQQPKANCTDNGTYVNGKGQTVKRPENCSTAPQGATAQCRDGTYSFSRSKRGTCSHHGGVAHWL
jgi:resuscitation-promoting factor RpfB